MMREKACLATAMERRARLALYESSISDKLDLIARLKAEAARRQLSNFQMESVLREYEATLVEMSMLRDHHAHQFIDDMRRLVEERDQAANTLGDIERCFGALQKKYGRVSQVLRDFQNNEVLLKTHEQWLHSKLADQCSNYEMIEEHFWDSLSKTNRAIERYSESHMEKVEELMAYLRQTEAKASALNDTAIRKTRENEDLTKICDELITEVKPM